MTNDRAAVARAFDHAQAAYVRAVPDENRPAWMVAFFDQAETEPAVSTATRAGIEHPRVALMLEQFGNKVHTMAPRSQAARSWDEFAESRRDFA